MLVYQQLPHIHKAQKTPSSLDVFTELLPMQNEATQRAKERIVQLERNGTSVLSRDSNPCTTVYELVAYLNGMNG